MIFNQKILSIGRDIREEEEEERKKKTALEFTGRDKDLVLLTTNTAVKHQGVSPWIHVSQLRRNSEFHTSEKSYQQGTSN